MIQAKHGTLFWSALVGLCALSSGFLVYTDLQVRATLRTMPMVLADNPSAPAVQRSLASPHRAVTPPKKKLAAMAPDPSNE